jgi:para-aminobenzoate synthetase component 1
MSAVERIDGVLVTPVVAAGRLRRDAGGGFVFLDTQLPPEEASGAASDDTDGPVFSVIGRRPWRTLWKKGEVTCLDGIADARDLLALMRSLLSVGQAGSAAGFGPDHLFGFLSYDLSLPLLSVPAPPMLPDDPSLPDAWFQSFDELVVFDHRSGETTIVTGGRLRPSSESLSELRAALTRPERPDETLPTPPSGTHSELGSGDLLVSNVSREDYMDAVERVRSYIAAGDVYIVNLSRRLTAEATRPVWDNYLQLRACSPVPYGAFFEVAESVGATKPFAILSASMECFLRVCGTAASTVPIKGTRPRGTTQSEDEALRRELLESAKDRAELLMIVDLERNDLARVSCPDSIEVHDLFQVKPYASVYHLDAKVTGRIAPGQDAVDALFVLFPGGSITGAPKKRSMEIISELEGVRRGVYTGVLGWLSPEGDASFSILIRTLVRQGSRLWYSTGGGITWDSDPAAEYDETCDKAKSLEKVV